jgi:hypothetical protein
MIKRKNENKIKISVRHMTSIEFHAITFVTTLILAGIVIVLGIKEPVVWSFLSTAIGISLGQAIQIGRN